MWLRTAGLQNVLVSSSLPNTQLLESWRHYVATLTHPAVTETLLILFVVGFDLPAIAVESGADKNG